MPGQAGPESAGAPEPGPQAESGLGGVVDGLAAGVDASLARMWAGPDGYWLAYSGGKDSVVILELCKMAGVKFEAHHSLTTIDPPELVRFVKATPGVIIDRPKQSFFQLLVKKGFPLRQSRWCCAELKEGAGKGRVVITGVRWAESVRRSKRKMFDVCYRDSGSRLLHPIIDWSDEQVWEFIRSRNLPYCSLYDQGRSRIGCLFCPMAKPRERQMDLVKYPKYANAFRKAFQRFYEDRMVRNPAAVNRHADGYALFDWWVNEDKGKQLDDGGLFE